MQSSIAAIKRQRPRVVVAIPAKDEAERIGACLEALNRQEEPPDEVLLLLNNCTDETELIARSITATTRQFDLQIEARVLPPEQANAGHARRLAMALAAMRAGKDGVLLTTDADSVVPPDWISRNVAGLLRGADLVCGCAVVECIEAAMIPAHLHADDVLERRLIALEDEMAWIVDPDPYDPPPRHIEASGASLAVWVAAFQRVGGIPAVASGEDRAFVEALRRVDARIRHDPAIRVTVSGRTVGRAAGGMADTIRRRMVQQDEYADDSVEPAETMFRRLDLRRRARAVRSGGYPNAALAVDLMLDPAWLEVILSGPFFGAAWASIEAVSPALTRRPVRFTDLPAEIAIATRLLTQITAPETMAAD